MLCVGHFGKLEWRKGGNHIGLLASTQHVHAANKRISTVQQAQAKADKSISHRHGLQHQKAMHGRPVEDASFVHVIHCSDQLVHVALDSVLCHIMTAPADELIDVHIHELKHKR